MPELRACKECGKMFMPKGREKYCPEVHYRPCPICGTPVVAKYLSDPPGKCENCKKKKIQPVSKAKSIFNMGGGSIPSIKPMNNEIAKIQPVAPIAIKEVPEEVDDENRLNEKPAGQEEVAEVKFVKQSFNSNGVKKIDVSKVLEPEVFCETYDDKIMRYIGPTVDGYHKFENNHDYKIALTRKDKTYLITSCHDVTTGQEVNCYYIASSQQSVSTRFAIVEQV